MKKYVNFLGVGLNPLTYDELFNVVDEARKDKTGRSYHIACLNAYCIALSVRNKELQRIYNSADVAGADGMPFVRYMRTVSREKCDRIAAPDTILKLAEHAKIKNYTFYLYGGSPEVCERMKSYLEEKFPYIRIVGHYSPPFRELTQEEDDRIVADINALQPDIICIGLGTPKQDYWIDTHINKVKGSVLIASGATFDFFGGRIKMAPEFIRRSGFEWVYRLLGKDFKRLWRRYILFHGFFVVNFVLQKTRIMSYEVVKQQRA